jgi:hypothetical protein
MEAAPEGSDKDMLRRFMILGGLIFGVWGLAVLWASWDFIVLGFLILTGSLTPCANDIVQEALSPDGTRRAVVFQRDCGATTWFTTQVAIVWGANDLPDKPANVFIADDHPDTTRTEVYWLNSATLQVVTQALHGAHKAERHVGGVTVRYESR